MQPWTRTSKGWNRTRRKVVREAARRRGSVGPHKRVRAEARRTICIGAARHLILGPSTRYRYRQLTMMRLATPFWLIWQVCFVFYFAVSHLKCGWRLVVVVDQDHVFIRKVLLRWIWTSSKFSAVLNKTRGENKDANEFGQCRVLCGFYFHFLINYW